MKNLLKFIAALAVLAGVVLLVLEFMKRREEDDKRKSDRALRRLVKDRQNADDGMIADYRFDDDDDEAFCCFESDTPEDNVPDGHEAPAEEDTFYLSEDALEQLLDN